MISVKTTMLMQLASRSRTHDLHKLCPAIQHVRAKHSNVQADILQSYQGRDHEFGQHRAVEVLSKAMEMNEMGKNGNGPYVHGVEPGIHGDKSRVPSTDVCSRDKDIGNYNNQGTISLSSVMQSNVPEPFQAGKDNDLIHDYGNPTYQNMPGGMVPLENRYVNSSRLDLKQPKVLKRGLSTTAVHLSEKLAGDNELSFPQGIQGSEEDKKRFAVFKENCKKYGLAECDELLQGVQTGRHTLSHVFDEQDKIIKRKQDQEDQRAA